VADFKQNYFQRRTKDRGPRSNNRISSPDVQVIGSDGENFGVINTNEAISMAKNQGLDLIEIAANANPPRSEEHTSELQSRLHLVCRLLLEKKKKTETSKQTPNYAATNHNPLLNTPT